MAFCRASYKVGVVKTGVIKRESRSAENAILDCGMLDISIDEILNSREFGRVPTRSKYSSGDGLFRRQGNADRPPNLVHRRGLGNPRNDGLILNNDLSRVGVARNQNYGDASFSHHFGSGQAIDHRHIQVDERHVDV